MSNKLSVNCECGREIICCDLCGEKDSPVPPLVRAAREMMEEFRGYDLPYGSKAYLHMNEALAPFQEVQ